MSTIEKALQKQGRAKKQASAKSLEDVENGNKQEVENPNSDVVVTEPTAKTEISQSEIQKKFLHLDIELLEERGFVSVDSARRLINEEFRAIKRKLLTNAFGQISESLNNSNIIMVSSASPSEGKTFTAVNLALSIAAEKDKTVLLVDADVLKPNVTRTLEVKASDGLMEYLLDEKHDIADVMYRTNIDKLRIIPAGRSHHLSTELLASQKMQETIDEIANRYPDRIVIIDTPPLIGINETAVLTNFAGQAVVVCVEGKTRLAELKRATSLLNDDMAIGFIVNKAIVSADEWGSYYGYYYAK